MSERLDQTTHLPLGTRDAVHVPVIAGRFNYKTSFPELEPGSFVKFVDKDFTLFELCEKKDAHGFINPYLDEIYYFDNVLIFILPNITTPVRHYFEINLQQKTNEREVLEAELEEMKRNDESCAECYEIRNNEIIRM